MKNLYLVRKNLFRSGALSDDDVQFLHDHLDIGKIISLDEDAGDAIYDICHQLGITQEIIDIIPDDLNSIKNLLQYNINDLINEDIPTLVHCKRGKDRTGLFVALVRVLLDHWSAKQAIDEAKKLGFGTGIEWETEDFYINLIRRAAKQNDTNHLEDAAQVIRDSDSIVRDEQIDPYNGYSWAPEINYDYKYPGANYLDQQVRSPYKTRQDLMNEDLRMPEFGFNRVILDDSTFPQTGVPSEVAQITNSAGPSVLSGGFI